MIGLLAEGTTDLRFLSSIVRRTCEQVAFDCWGEIEILEIMPLKAQGNGLVEQVLHAAKTGIEAYGITLLCVHTDADSPSNKIAYAHKIKAALQALNASADERCQHLVPLVPVPMQEP